MAVDKNKRKTTTKANINSRLTHFLQSSLWQICLLIALCDLGHALFFVVNATISLLTRFNIYSTLALMGTVFWVLVVVLLIVGLTMRRPILVKIWLIFSIIGFIVDIGFSIWGIVSSVTVDVDHLKEFSIIFVGVFIESICIYLVYRYYLGMDPCRLIDEPERGKKRTTKKNRDDRACKDSQRKPKAHEKKTVKKKPEKKKPTKK
ncbi:PREDICTED: uncharacterized protein LOC108614086 [Drosophila arizonae]|uniref:Uncharacterized protein LOC108614086 n=1 Tax=Drosophila arizonae TaxID=7263 RepID=A0ABM1P8F5_DROAR|nr:PREDICTED: uncharacterized protein LOC108614086 [Drosophila arizonae]